VRKVTPASFLPRCLLISASETADESFQLVEDFCLGPCYS
jgi:hypothetical protein